MLPLRSLVLPRRAVVTTEAPAAPILLSLYADCGLVGRVELSPRDALRLSADLLKHVTEKEPA